MFVSTACNFGSVSSEELKTGLCIMVSFENCKNADEHENGIAEATALVVGVAANEQGKIKKQITDVIRAKVCFDEKGTITYVYGTPESVSDSDYEIDKDVLSVAKEAALENAQFMGAKQGDDFTLKLYADFAESKDAFAGIEGEAIINIYAGFCANEDELITGANIKSYCAKICYTEEGIITKTESNEILISEGFAFASYCKDKSKEEIADLSVDYYTGLVKVSSLLRECNCSVLPFIEVIK